MTGSLVGEAGARPEELPLPAPSLDHEGPPSA
jgi:hypothetical protein